MKTYGICTLGCKVNTYESQSINEQLRNKGFIEKDFKDTFVMLKILEIDRDDSADDRLYKDIVKN